ncbi:MAG: DMT family transporter [Candidatus Methylomirabilales bacterium]
MPGAEERQVAVPLVRIYLLLFLTIVLWGGSPVAGKLAVRELPPVTVGVLRYGAASLVLFALFGGRLPAWREIDRTDRWLLVSVGVVGTFLNHIFFYVGLFLAPASHGAILSPTTSPIWTMLLAARFGGERITRAQVGGMMLCMAGVVLVAWPGSSAVTMTGMVLLGDLLLLMSGLAWGSYSFLTKVTMRRLSAMATLAYGMVIGSVLLVPVALLERPWGSLAGASFETWASVLYVTVAATLLASFWWSLAIQRMGAGRTAVFGNLTPVFGVLLSWGVLGDRLTPLQLLGGLLTLAGVWVCQGPAAMRAAWRQARVRLRSAEVPEPERR